MKSFQSCFLTSNLRSLVSQRQIFHYFFLFHFFHQVSSEMVKNARTSMSAATATSVYFYAIISSEATTARVLTVITSLVTWCHVLT